MSYRRDKSDVLRKFQKPKRLTADERQFLTRVETELGKKLTVDEQNDWFIEFNGSLSAADIAQRIRKDRAGGESQPPLRQTDLDPWASSFSHHEKEMDTWVQAVSRVRFLDANQREDVEAFRNAFVDDYPVPADGIAKWIAERKPAAPAMYVTVIAPPGWTPDQPLAAEKHSGRGYRSRSFELVEYPDNGWMGHQAVDAGGVLDELRLLSLDLSRTFGWQPAQAVGFVLCGVWPVVQPVVVTLGTNLGARRISIDVDPDVSSDELVNAYNIARATWHSRGGEASTFRTKRPTEKALRMVRDWTYDSRVPEITERQRERWNASQPDDRSLRAYRQALKGALAQLRRHPETRD